MFFRQIVDEKLSQFAYLIGCQRTGEAIVIDPERDVERYVEIAEANHLRVTAVTETHIHADFLSGCREFAERYGVKVYLSGEGADSDWQYRWGDAYDHRLLMDGDHFSVGNIDLQAVFTPGHTPEHLSFLVTDRGGGADEPMGVASGDFVFVNDLGRPDLLESAAGQAGAMRPSAVQLFESAQRFVLFPEFLQVWPGHGAGSACGKALGAVPETTVGYEKRFNPALVAARAGEDAFVNFVLEGQPEPPLYFARMKKLNRDGPPLLGQVPSPTQVFPSAVAEVVGRRQAVIVDTRLDREAYFAGHLPGSVYAPFGKNLPTIVGSYVEPDARVFLVIDECHLDEAVKCLIRIGYDHIDGYITVETLESYQRSGGLLETIESVDLHEFESRLKSNAYRVLDVRRKTEYDERHVEGAQNIAHTRLAARIGELETESPILVHCRTGERASAAVSLLKRRGFKVVHVSGNFETWKPGVELVV